MTAILLKLFLLCSLFSSLKILNFALILSSFSAKSSTNFIFSSSSNKAYAEKMRYNRWNWQTVKAGNLIAGIPLLCSKILIFRDVEKGFEWGKTNAENSIFVSISIRILLFLSVVWISSLLSRLTNNEDWFALKFGMLYFSYWKDKRPLVKMCYNSFENRLFLMVLTSRIQLFDETFPSTRGRIGGSMKCHTLSWNSESINGCNIRNCT